MTRNQSRQVTILPGLLAIGTLVVEIYAFSLPGDLDTMASPPPVWLVSFELNPVGVPAAKFGDHNMVLKKCRYQFLYQLLHQYIGKRWTHHLEPPYCEILRSGIPIYNSKVPDTAARKTRRRTQAITYRFAFHTNAIKLAASMTQENQYFHFQHHGNLNLNLVDFPKNLCNGHL